MEIKFNYKEISSISREIHSKNGFISYILYFFSAILASGFILLNLFVSELFILTVPFFVIPIYFACQAATTLMRDQNTLTFKGFINCYFVYYSEHFRSTFKVLRSSLFALIFFGSVLLTSFIVVPITFYSTNYYGFASLVNSVSKIITAEEIEAILNSNKELINMMSIVIILPALSIFSIVFLYLISKNSFSLFYRINEPKYTGKFIQYVSDIVRKKHKSLFLKCYWSLNYPIVILFLLSFGLGLFVGYLYHFDANSMFTFALAVSTFLSFGIAGPKYLANKEAISIYLFPIYSTELGVLQGQFKDTISRLFDNLEQKDEIKNDSDES